MGDANQATTLSLQDVIQIITTAKAGGAIPALVGMQIFGSLGANTTVSGDNLRMALTASGVPIDGPLAPALAAIQTVAKDNDHITITNIQEVEVTLGETRTRVKEELSFDVAATAGLPALNNIQGLQAHKMIWISIQKIELIQNQGRSSVRVTAAGTTKDIPLG
jgi:hypothetical protein